MLLAIPARVQGSVAEPKIGGEVDDLVGPPLQVRRQLLRHPVGKGQEDEVEAVGEGGVVGLEAGARVGGGQARVEVGDLGARLGLPHGPRQFELRVLEAQPQELSPRIAGGPDNADSVHGKPAYGSVNNNAKSLVGPVS